MENEKNTAQSKIENVFQSYSREIKDLPLLDKEEEGKAVMRIKELKAEFRRDIYASQYGMQAICNFYDNALQHYKDGRLRLGRATAKKLDLILKSVKINYEAMQKSRGRKRTIIARGTARLLEDLEESMDVAGVENTLLPFDILRGYQQATAEVTGLERASAAYKKLEDKFGEEFEKTHGELEDKRRKITEAEQKFAEANLRLVISITEKYRHYGMPLEDLIGEGNIGLMKAINRYELGHGTKFSTYATYWIRQAILRALTKYVKQIEAPLRMVSEIAKYQKKEEQLSHELERKPAYDEVIKSLKCPRNLAEKMKRALVRVVSYDNSPEEDKERFLIEVICDGPENSGTLYRTLSAGKNCNPRMLDEEKIRKIISLLPPSYQEVINRRFGIGCEPGSLRQIGKQMKCSVECVRQIEKKALEKLRLRMTIAGIRPQTIN
jgi:RNA polymerase primary sigma factor